MKIIHLLDSFERGGIEILALDVCRNARANDFDLTVVATGGGELEADFEASGVEFIKLKRRFPVDPQIVFALRKIIRERGARVVHTYQAVEGMHAYLACKGTNAKTVLSHHGFVADRKNLLALRFLLPRVAVNVVVTRGLKNWLEREMKLDFPAGTEIIYNGVDEKRLKWSGESLKQELNLPTDAAIFGMIANFYRDPRKDQMTVCRALPPVFAEHKNAVCVFVGEVESGAEEKHDECVRFCRENDIAERVFFLGKRTDVPKILDALDVHVFSSIQEGLGIAALEAMLARVPCVLSDIEPFLEISENGAFAEIFPVGKHEILSRKILRLFGDRAARADLAARAYRYAHDNFSIEAHLRQLGKLYESLAAKK